MLAVQVSPEMAVSPVEVIASDRFKGQTALLGPLDHAQAQLRLGRKLAPFGNAELLAQGSKIGRKPLGGQKEFAVHQRPGGPRPAFPVGVAQHHRYLAGIHLAHPPIVLTTGASTVNVGFLVGALIQDQKAALGQLRRGTNVFLDALINPLAWPGRVRHEMLHRLTVVAFHLPSDPRIVTVFVHCQLTAQVLVSMFAGIPGARSEAFAKPFPMLAQSVR